VTQTNTTTRPPRRWNIVDRLILLVASRFGAQAKEVERFLKFAIVGTIGAIVDFGVLNVLQTTLLTPVGEFETLHVRLSTGIAFSAAVTSNFIWNRYWTYPDSRSRTISVQLVQFFIVNTVGLVFRLIFVGAFYQPMGEAAYDFIGGNPSLETLNQLGTNIAQAIAVIIVLFWNFFVNRYWTYNDVDQAVTLVQDDADTATN
jgi:putative flippase GtrA